MDTDNNQVDDQQNVNDQHNDERDEQHESNLGTKLPQDYGTPFSPPSGAQDRIDETHQVADTNIDPGEHYQKGIEGAAGVDLPGQAADESGDIPRPEGAP